MVERLAYFPALDGLRAVAVVSVVAYHLELPWARGGFLGVDLFFVISGYLITALLLREHSATGRVDVRSFWVRRFRRLVPLLVVMTVATVAAARLWGVPEQWTSVRWDALAALGYVANWRFIVADQSYFDTLIGPSPLRHTWSLAVEEQWYLLWPIVMLGVVALLGRRAGWTLAFASIVAATVASAAWMATLYVADDPSRAYYGTDTRAQQLLVGGALALALHRWPQIASIGRRGRLAIGALAAVAAFAVAVSTASDDSSVLFHGGFLAVSVLCAVMVAASANTEVATPLRWLESAPLNWIGLRSYGIYLWHWPVIVYVGTPTGIEWDGIRLIALQVLITLALADASHRVIERRIRFTAWRPGALIWTWSAAAGLAALVSVTVLTTPADRTLSNAESIQPPGLAGDDDRERRSATAAAPTVTSDAVPQWIEPALLGAEPEPPDARSPDERDRALGLGDSTAFQLLTQRDLDAPDDGWDVFGSARIGCGFVDGRAIDSDSSEPVSRPPECEQWRTEFADAVDDVRPHVTIVMIGAWEVLDHLIDGVEVRFPSRGWYDSVRTAVDEVVAIAAASDAPVIAMTLPCMRPSGDDRTTARTEQSRVDAFNDIVRDVAIDHPLVSVFDLAELLCPGGEYLETVDGNELRYDGVHLTTAGSDLVWSRLLPEMDGLKSR